MTVEFYSMNDEKNKINKTLENPFIIENVYFKEKNIDITRPFLKLSNFDYTQYNYCYVRELAKYYFFDTVEIENTAIIKIHLKEDVLMTCKNTVLNTYLNIVECEKNFVNSEKATAEKKDNLILTKIDIDVKNLFNNDKIIMVVHK